jgi:predicted Zn-dependent peptidase
MMLREPLINENTVKEAAKNSKQNLIRINEKPNSYAIFKAFEMAGENQTFGLNVFGYTTDYDEVTVADMVDFHQLCLNTFRKEIYVAGDVQKLDIKDFDESTHYQSLTKTEIESRTITQVNASNQSEIVQVYPVLIDPHHRLYYPYLTLLAILGQSPSSLLFQNIREKESLCYSIYASQLIYDGLFYIGSSVKVESEARVVSLIAQQFEEIKKGNYDLPSTKQYLYNRIKGTKETTRGLLDLSFRNNRLQLNDNEATMLDKFSRVSETEILEVLNHIGKPFTFIYKGVSV